jgi:hypothetical protein
MTRRRRLPGVGCRDGTDPARHCHDAGDAALTRVVNRLLRLLQVMPCRGGGGCEPVLGALDDGHARASRAQHSDIGETRMLFDLRVQPLRYVVLFSCSRSWRLGRPSRRLFDVLSGRVTKRVIGSAFGEQPARSVRASASSRSSQIDRGSCRHRHRRPPCDDYSGAIRHVHTMRRHRPAWSISRRRRTKR